MQKANITIIDLNEYMISSILEFLAFYDIYLKASHTCRKFFKCSKQLNLLQKLALELDYPFEALNQSLRFPIKNLKYLILKPRILKFVGYYTNGGVYRNSTSFWVGNLFEYSGTCYTAKKTENVHVFGIFGGKTIPRQAFFKRHNEDLAIQLQSIPNQLQKNQIPTDIFLTNDPP